LRREAVEILKKIKGKGGAAGSEERGAAAKEKRTAILVGKKNPGQRGED